MNAKRSIQRSINVTLSHLPIDTAAKHTIHTYIKYILGIHTVQNTSRNSTCGIEMYLQLYIH